MVEVEFVQEYHNINKLAYAVGNVTFVVFIKKEILPVYFLYYSFGDNTSATLKVQDHTSNTSQIHSYTDVCNNCSYDVTVIILSELRKSPVYRTDRGVINVISE